MEKPKRISTRQYTKGKTRSVDSLRGIAVLLMLIYHFLVWMLKTSARGYFFRAVQVLGTFFAPPMFFIVTGITLSFSVGRRKLQGDSNKMISSYVIRRYGGLVLLGFLLNVVVWGPKSIWIWDVLEVIGLCNIITFLISLISSEIIMLIAGLLGVGSYYLARSIELPWILEVILKNPLEGTFPVGPFLLFTIVGYLFGSYVIRIIRGEKGVKLCIYCMQSGITSLFVSLILNIAGLTIKRYPITISYIFFSVGVTLLVFGLLFWWQDVKEKKAVVFAPIMVYGRYALVIYIGHYLVYKLFYILDLRRRFWLPSAIMMTILFLAIILGVIVYIRPNIWRDVTGAKIKKTT